SVGIGIYTRRADTGGAGQADKNCSDFMTSAQAQRFFLAAGGPHRDSHDLDRDGDGFACEWGIALQAGARMARHARPVVAPAVSRPTYRTATCYVARVVAAIP